MSRFGWIGVDLDGTLAEYDGWKGELHIGAPIGLMIERVKQWIAEGVDVRIFTARMCGDDGRDVQLVRDVIESWCVEHLGFALLITNVKDYGMTELWDDKAVQVIRNTGIRADGA